MPRGRDIEEAELAIRFNRSTCKWTILGQADLSRLYDGPQRPASVRGLTRRRRLSRLVETRSPNKPRQARSVGTSKAAQQKGPDGN
jgi:hypothetical protein